MSEPVWYYARGEVEKGPLSTVQIKALAAAGKVRPDDYVWKEGMENWVPAGEIQELFPAEAARTKERGPEPEAGEAETAIVTVRGTPRRPTAARAVEWLAIVRVTSRGLLLAGLATVLIARGCDRLGERYVARLQAVAAAAETSFRIDWETRRRQMEGQIRQAEKSTARTPADQEALKRLSSQLAELNDTKRAQEAHLQQTSWQGLRSAAEQADAENRIWGLWRELGIQLGTLMLAAGAIALGYASEGPERWMCYAVLTVILYVACKCQLPP